MEDIDAVKKIMHFYFCLLVNIKIRKVNSSGMKNNENSRLIKKWLKSAKEKKIFNPLVCQEVDWLISEVDKYSPLQFEDRIQKIYFLSKELIEEFDRNNKL